MGSGFGKIAVVKAVLCVRTQGQLHARLGLDLVVSVFGDWPRRDGVMSSKTPRVVPSNRFTIARCAKVRIDGQAKPTSELEEVFQQVLALCREDGLWMELDAVHGEQFVL